jgi:poly(3-hydroxybutyrate) depolymerase
MNAMKTLLLVLLGCAALGAAAKTPVPSGKWSWVFTDKQGQSNRPIKVYTYRPRACDSTCPMWIVLHGTGRNASGMRDTWVDLADRYKFLVVAPEFSQKEWPRAALYNLGDVAGNDNPEKWTYAAIDHLFEEMSDGQADYRLFGHSAGGQFVHRMMLLRPQSKASLYVAGNPGWYLVPEWRKEKIDVAYPYSLVGSKAGEAQVREALGKKFILLVGEKDSDPDDEQLNNTDGAKKQGANRVERGENFIKAATRVAGELGIPFTWQFVEVPETAHDATAISNAAAVQLYGKR